MQARAGEPAGVIWLASVGDEALDTGSLVATDDGVLFIDGDGNRAGTSVAGVAACGIRTLCLSPPASFFFLLFPSLSICRWSPYW